ncbi:ion channel [Methylobacterium sp. Leaf99]|uniref:ion channel n=1 Tax=Methylobacterium sp. Leaf99 TaxID=1736251 RepID=UPI0009E8EADE
MYSSNLEHLLNAKHSIDGYYFSAITQFTIGYGDILPIGFLKILVVFQSFISTIFVIIIFARVLSLFSPIISLKDTDKP